MKAWIAKNKETGEYVDYTFTMQSEKFCHIKLVCYAGYQETINKHEIVELEVKEATNGD